MQTGVTNRRSFLQRAAALGALGWATLAGASPARGDTPAASNNPTAAAPPASPRLAEFGFTKLLVADLDRSAAFYEAVCGVVQSARIEGVIGGRKITEIVYPPATPGGAMFVLLTYHGTVKPAADEVMVGFNTTDLDAFLVRARAAGGTVFEEPRTLAEMKLRVAFVKDLEGHIIEVLQAI